MGYCGERPLLRPLIALAVPIVLANAVHTLHQLVNTFWVGRLGAGAVAAVSVSFPIIFLLASLGSGLSIGGSVLAAQYYGACDTRMQRLIAGQLLVMTLLLSLLLTTAGVLAAPSLLSLLAIEPSVFGAALEYLRISLLGIFPAFVFLMYQALMRSAGDGRRPLYLVGVSVLLNLLLDPPLIFGWGPLPALGVAGAAWATLIAQAIAALCGVFLLTSARLGVKLSWLQLKPDWPLMARLAQLSLPASLEQSMQALGIAAVTALVATFGTVVVGAYGIGLRVLTFAIIPALGISMAASILVGQSIGAGDFARAERFTRLSALTSFAFLSAAGLILSLLAVPLIRAFIPGDEAMIASGAEALRWLSMGFGLMGVQLSLAGTFRGAGDTRAAMLLSAIGTWLVQLPLAWLLGTQTPFGASGIWMAYPLAALINTLFSLWYLRAGHWRDYGLASAETKDAGSLTTAIN